MDDDVAKLELKANEGIQNWKKRSFMMLLIFPIIERYLEKYVSFMYTNVFFCISNEENKH